MNRVTALPGRRPGNPGRRPPRNPAGMARPVTQQTLDLPDMLWQQLSQMNRIMAAVYREVA
ncbi:MAG: hypothetical protein QME79_14660 [Bacillota bacterium]|nr:hypothetical protein [Bacillota bacterium]